MNWIGNMYVCVLVCMCVCLLICMYVCMQYMLCKNNNKNNSYNENNLYFLVLYVLYNFGYDFDDDFGFNFFYKLLKNTTQYNTIRYITILINKHTYTHKICNNNNINKQQSAFTLHMYRSADRS